MLLRGPGCDAAINLIFASDSLPLTILYTVTVGHIGRAEPLEDREA